MAASVDFLKAIYLDATTTIRHYDTIRATFTQIFVSILTVSTTIFVASSMQDMPSYMRISGSITLVGLCALAIVAVAKINSLIDLQRRRATNAMKKFGDIVKTTDYKAINEEAKLEQKNILLTRLPLSRIWAGFFYLILMLNIGVLFRTALI